MGGLAVQIPKGARMTSLCFEPKSFAANNGREFVATRLVSGQTYVIDYVQGPLAANPVTFKEESGMDFQAVTVKTPDGEYVPFLFTVKKLFAKGDGDVFKPGFTWSGQFEVPTYQNGAFQDA